MEELKKLYIGMAIVTIVVIVIAIDQTREFRWNEKHFKKMSKKHVKNVEKIIAISIGALLLWWYICSCFKHFDLVWLTLGIDAIAVIAFLFPLVIINLQIDNQRGYGILTAKYLAKQKKTKAKK